MKNSGSGNIYEYQERQEKFPNFVFLSISAILCRKSYKILIYATGIHKIIHKNGIHNYSSAFRNQSYRRIFVVRGRPNKSEIG